MRREGNFGTGVAEILRKIGERREKWCDGCGREEKEFQQWYCQKNNNNNKKKQIVAIELPKLEN